MVGKSTLWCSERLSPGCHLSIWMSIRNTKQDENNFSDTETRWLVWCTVKETVVTMLSPASILLPTDVSLALQPSNMSIPPLASQLFPNASFCPIVQNPLIVCLWKSESVPSLIYSFSQYWACSDVEPKTAEDHIVNWAGYVSSISWFETGHQMIRVPPILI